MITEAILDDRVAFVGTTGSGKTYAAKGMIERLLLSGARVCIVDPLGVWYGLRAGPDGDVADGLPTLILGGLHADVPIAEQDGAALGRLVGTSAAQCVIDLSELGSGAARRRFMSAFAGAVYDANHEPLHLILDEADLWAPQRPLPDQAALQGKIGEIVRRGRVRGFKPWLITQRPAVLDKDVLSQADTLIAMKLTSSQDRAAIGAWIEGQADRAQEKAVLADLPRLHTGEGYVWAPSHGVLERTKFPQIRTFDSSRTPKRGERVTSLRALAPVDATAVLATLAKERQPTPAAKHDDAKAEERGYQRGRGEASAEIAALRDKVCEMQAAIDGALGCLAAQIDRSDGQIPLIDVRRPPPTIDAQPVGPKRPARTVAQPRTNGAALPGPQLHVLGALAWWAAMGHDQPTRAQVAGIAGWKITSGHLKNVCGALRSAGMIDYPTSGTIALTDAGRSHAPSADTSISLHDRVRGALTGPQRLVFDDLVRHRRRSRDALALAVGWEPTSGHIKNVLGSMRTLELIEYPAAGHVALQGWLQ